MNPTGKIPGHPVVWRFSALPIVFALAIAGCRDPGEDHRLTAGDTPESGSASALESSQISPATGQTHKLFDGQSLDNWQIIQFGGQQNIGVRDGAVVAEAGYPFAGIRFVGDGLPGNNYTLELEAQKQDGTDFFCCVTFPVRDEFCSLVLGGWGGPVSGISCINGVDASENRTRFLKKYNIGQWYAIRIDVTDHRVACRIDGHLIVDLPTDGIRFSLRNDVLPTSPLGICAYQTKSAWRNIRLTQPALAENESDTPGD